MSRRVSVAEARNHLTELLREVEEGARIEVTRRGEPIAVIVSAAEHRRMQVERPSLAERLHAWRKACPDDFVAFTDEEVETWRDRRPAPRRARFP